jgi:hypothetical protein
MWSSTSRRSCVSTRAERSPYRLPSVCTSDVALVPRLRIPHSHPHALTPTPWNLACSSIAGRRASGFLQVSLSKVSRHGHRAARPATRAETPPMNANDFRGVTEGRILSSIIWPNPCGRGSRQTPAAPRPAEYRSASRRATRPESSDPRTSSREDERETGATESLPGTHFP